MSLFFGIGMMVVAIILFVKSFWVLGASCLGIAGACFIASDICHVIRERDKADATAWTAKTGKDEEKPTFKESVEAMRAMSDILDKIEKAEKTEKSDD